MEKQETAKKQTKRRSGAGRVFLILFLLLLGAVGFLFYSVCMAPANVDDPQQMAALNPMPAAERFRFSAADRTTRIKVNASDIWNLVLNYAGEDFLDKVNQELSAFSVSVSGCGIQINENGPQLNLELFYKDFRLVAKVPCTLEASGQHFCFKPAGVKLGVIPLPVSEFLSSVNLEFDLQLPVLSHVEEISYEKGAILITGNMREDIRSLLLPERKMHRYTVFNETVQPLLDAMQTDAGYEALLAQLEKDPGSIETFYREMFLLTGSKNTEEYLELRKGTTQWILPGIDFSTLEASRTEMREREAPLNAMLEQMFSTVINNYNWKGYTLSDGEFLRMLQPFHATDYGDGSYTAMFDVLDPDSFFLVLVNAENGFIRNTPTLDQLADEHQQFTKPVDFSKTYIVGCVFRSMTGIPLLMYEIEVPTNDSYYNDIMIQVLSEEEASALQVPGKFGVWTD